MGLLPTVFGADGAPELLKFLVQMRYGLPFAFVLWKAKPHIGNVPVQHK